ncbi:flavonoid 3-O-glucosyltransferase-like [Hibiscus syriacus]|uniref:flavonoid 3-O-glucosyltransferase-like n=1 Tax=Hibiscus syriacus TaxID=106335 RepID=UPI00192044D5|nr:flavonoid 3-O-glucosyltransferase-like [Hibiscus syriacus]
MYVSIGPINLVSVDDSRGCLDWLSEHDWETVVCFSFGTAITPPPHELQALCEARKESELPFLWSFRGNPEKQLPSGFLKRTSSKWKMVPWAPQQKISEHPSVGIKLVLEKECTDILDPSG